MRFKKQELVHLYHALEQAIRAYEERADGRGIDERSLRTAIERCAELRDKIAEQWA